MRLCIANFVAAIGGVERVIENYLDPMRSDLDEVAYVYQPFPALEPHLRHLQAANVSLWPVEDVVPSGQSISDWSAPATVRARPAAPPAARPSPALRVWKAVVPDSLDAFVYHSLRTRRFRARFRAVFEHLPFAPDIVHLFAGNYAWLAAAGQAARTAFPAAGLVLRLGNPPVFMKPGRRERKLFRDADAVLFVSRHTREAWETALGARLDNARVLPTPVPLDHIPAPDRPPPPAGRPVVLCTLGRLSPIKGIDVALRALRQARDAGVKTELRVMGSGPAESGLQALAGTLGISAAVRFMGFVEKPFPLFPEMDILLQPSLTTEGIPNSVLQAMAGGLAVIATPVGGLPEIIEHGVNGLLVPPGDADALATAITELASDAGRRAQLGLRAAAQVRQRHDARQAARDLLTVYQEAVAHRRGTSSSAW